jgi:hypothetical protein
MTHDNNNNNNDNDPRTRAKADGSPFSSHRGTVADVVLTDDESGDETHHAVPVCFEVCPTCQGSGRHVNPSADCHGLSREDFDDPDFREDYFGGRYDVDCYDCHGKNVVLAFDWDRIGKDPAAAALVNEWQEERDRQAEFDAIDAHERRMGC